MLSTTAFELVDYAPETFEVRREADGPTVGDSMRAERKQMGAGREIGQPGKYSEFYGPTSVDKDYESELIVAVAPKYSGPKNTRCDIYEYENGMFEIAGKVNHAQPSCVYLKQNFSITFHQQFGQDEARFFVERFGNLRPFSIQRQFDRLVWSSPQTARQYDTSIPQQVKLAPYLVSEHELKRQCQYKVVRRNDTLNYQLFEPLLGFQSGWGQMKAQRPFNQQNMLFPLAIQDYTLTVAMSSDKKSMVKRVLRDSGKAVTDDDYFERKSMGSEEYVNHLVNNPSASSLNVRIVDDANQKFQVSKLKLVSFLDDSAKQANKSTSRMSLHAPVFMNFMKRFRLPQDLDWDNPTLVETESFVSKPIIMGSDPHAPELKLPINTSKGFPSYFLIYLESAGVDYYSPGGYDNGGFGTDNIVGSHPKIANMSISLFGQDFPICRQLESVEELEHLTRKNCHRECNFAEQMCFDPIVFLKLEDLGLNSEALGYPNKKRLEMQVEVKQIIMPKYAYRQVINNDFIDCQLHCALIYENHCLQGTTNSADFYWK